MDMSEEEDSDWSDDLFFFEAGEQYHYQGLRPQVIPTETSREETSKPKSRKKKNKSARKKAREEKSRANASTEKQKDDHSTKQGTKENFQQNDEKTETQENKMASQSEDKSRPVNSRSQSPRAQPKKKTKKQLLSEQKRREKEMEDLANTLQRNQEEKARKEKEKQEKKAQKIQEEEARQRMIEEEEIRKLEEKERLEEQRLLEEKERLEEKKRLLEKQKLEKQKREQKKEQQKRELEKKKLEERKILKERHQLEMQRLQREQQFVESERRLRVELTTAKKSGSMSPTKQESSPRRGSESPVVHLREDISDHVQVSALPSGFIKGKFNPYLEDWGDEELVGSLTLNENKSIFKDIQVTNAGSEPPSVHDTTNGVEDNSRHQTLKAPLKLIAPKGGTDIPDAKPAISIPDQHHMNNITSATSKPFIAYDKLIPKNEYEEIEMLQRVLRESLGILETDRTDHHSNGVAMDELDDVDLTSYHGNRNSEITDEHFNLQYGAKPKTKSWHSNLQNQQTLGFSEKKAAESRPADIVRDPASHAPLDAESIWDYPQQNGVSSSFHGSQNFQQIQSPETPKKENKGYNNPAYHNQGNQFYQQKLSHNFGFNSPSGQQQHGNHYNSDSHSSDGHQSHVPQQSYVTNQQTYAQKLLSPKRHSQANHLQQQQNLPGLNHHSYNTGNQRRDLLSEFNQASPPVGQGQGQWNRVQPQLLRFPGHKTAQIPAFEVFPPMTFYNSSLHSTNQHQIGSQPFVRNLPNSQYQNF